MSGLVVSERGPTVGGRARAPGAASGCPRSPSFVLVIGALGGRDRARFDVQQFLLPDAERRSSARAGPSGTRSGRAGWYTFKEALGGFAIGSGARRPRARRSSAASGRSARR